MNRIRPEDPQREGANATGRLIAVPRTGDLAVAVAAALAVFVLIAVPEEPRSGTATVVSEPAGRPPAMPPRNPRS